MNLPPRRLLIVDDEELSRVAIRKLLSRLFPNQLVVGEAENGRAAVVASRDLNADVVIMDIKLPLMNGLDAAAQIKKDQPSTKVVMLSAHDSFGFAQQALNTGMEGYLLKPVTEREFQDVFGRVLQSFENAPEPEDAGVRAPYPWAAEEAFFASLSHDNLSAMGAAATALVGQLDLAASSRAFRESCRDLGAALRRVLSKLGAQGDLCDAVDAFAARLSEMTDRSQARDLLEETLARVTEGLVSQRDDNPRLRIQRAIHDTAWPELSLETVAAKLGMSPPYLSKVFKDAFGRKFVDFVTDLKLDEARRLLQTEPLTIREVCHRLGWSDAAHFSRLFKDSTGQSPKAWLKTHR